MPTGWIDICALEDIAVMGVRIVRRPLGQDIAIFRNEEEQVFALLDECPHKKAPLSQGGIAGSSVTCAVHQWEIGLHDGCVRGGNQGCVPRFSVKVVDERVLLSAEEIQTVGV